MDLSTRNPSHSFGLCPQRQETLPAVLLCVERGPKCYACHLSLRAHLELYFEKEKDNNIEEGRKMHEQ